MTPALATIGEQSRYSIPPKEAEVLQSEHSDLAGSALIFQGSDGEKVEGNVSKLLDDIESRLHLMHELGLLNEPNNSVVSVVSAELLLIAAHEQLEKAREAVGDKDSLHTTNEASRNFRIFEDARGPIKDLHPHIVCSHRILCHMIAWIELARHKLAELTDQPEAAESLQEVRTVDQRREAIQQRFETILSNAVSV